MDDGLRRNIQIVRDLTITDFKIKYNRNILGFFWSLLKPLLMLVTLYLVFHNLIKLDTPHYELFLLLGIILWTFFADATTYGMHAITRNTNLIKKMRMDRKLIILSTTLSAFISLMLNLVIFMVFLFVFGISLSWHVLLFAVLVAELFVFTLGVSLILASLYVKFRDLDHIWEVLLQIGFWVTPIIYPITLIPAKFHNIYILNPLARIIEDSRNALIFHMLPAIDFSYVKHIGITLFICLFAIGMGIIIFNVRSKRFAEQI